MLSRDTTVDRYDFIDSITVPSACARCSRRNASETMSSASATLPVMLYAI